jgi:hypothetical protein
MAAAQPIETVRLGHIEAWRVLETTGDNVLLSIERRGESAREKECRVSDGPGSPKT